jgi:hypothetical protein
MCWTMLERTTRRGELPMLESVADVADEDIDVVWDEPEEQRHEPLLLDLRDAGLAQDPRAEDPRAEEPDEPDEPEVPTIEIPPELMPPLVKASTLDAPAKVCSLVKASLQKTMGPKVLRLPVVKAVGKASLQTVDMPPEILMPLVKATIAEE